MAIETTERFWQLMCSPSAIRLSRLSLAVRGEIYVTLEAPEDVPGFMEKKIADVSILIDRTIGEK